MSDFETVFLESWQKTSGTCSLIKHVSMPSQGHAIPVYISGLVGFMGNGNLCGFIITHKPEWGFMGIYGYE